MTRNALLLVCLSAGLLVPVDRAAANPNDDFTNDDRIIEAHAAADRPTIDGRMDEAAWSTAPAATRFLQYEPNEGAEPSQRTEVRVLYGTDAVYIGARLYDTAPDQILATLGRRDNMNQADWFFASIDSYFDRKTAYTFGVNAAGVQLDGITTRSVDTSWDAVWQSAVRITPDGWTAELRIPLTMLRFSDGADTWGINFTRTIPRTSEEIEWAMVPRTVRSSGYVARYGRLMGVGDLTSRRNLQILPYSVSRLDTESTEVDGVQTSTGMDLGVDVKVGLTSNITLDATVNPDFGQVDSDPAELNLTAFETVLRERRPFFVEGAQILDFRLDFDGSLLYTRRIGSGEPIIGATKLTGRTEGGLSFGVLGAATGEDFDPHRLFSIVRARKELGRYSYVGGIGTAFNRRIGEEGITSFTAGADWDLRFLGNAYQVEGFATVGRRAGSYLDSVQEGFAGALSFGRVRGTITWDAGFRLFSDDYNPNDIGRLRRNNYMRALVSSGYQVNGGRPFGPFIRGSFRGWAYQSWSYVERWNLGSGVNLSGDFVTRGFQRVQLRTEINNPFGGLDPYESRGMGPVQNPASWSVRAEFETDSRRSWSVSPNANYARASDGGSSFRTGLDADWNAGSRLTLSAGVGLSHGDNSPAWASNETFDFSGGAWHIGTASGSPEDLGENDFTPFSGGVELHHALGAGDGTRYASVFGRRDTRSLDVSMRSNITFTPRLSLQLYGQLFGARGRYHDFMVLQSDGSLEDLASYPKRHDFSLSSFQTNVVLRWEYRPGSALFVVWSQARADRLVLDPLDIGAASPFGVSAVDQLTDTFQLLPKNAFLIKLNYLFMP